MIVATTSNLYADTYTDVDTATAFLSKMGYEVTVTEALLYRAMNYLKWLQYKGYQVSSSQPLPFPRNYVYLNDWNVATAEQTLEIIAEVQSWIVYYVEIEGIDPDSGVSELGNIIREKVDVIDTQYSDNNNTDKVYSLKHMPLVMNSLNMLIESNTRLERA